MIVVTAMANPDGDLEGNPDLGLSVQDVRRLARSQRNGGEDALETYFGWREAKVLLLVKGTAGAAASLLTAWLIPFLKNEYHDSSTFLVVVVPVMLIAALAITALVAYGRLNRTHRAFVRAVGLLQVQP